MIIKKYVLSIAGALAATMGYSQDLINKVPADAQFVAVINNRAIVKHASFDMLNQTLAKLGVFEIIGKENNIAANSLSDFDLATDRNAYLYRTAQDSVSYIGILIPLKGDKAGSPHKVADIGFKDYLQDAAPAGYTALLHKDGLSKVVWNDNMLFVLSAEAESSFFQQYENGTRYGMEIDSVDAAAYDYSYDESEAIEAAQVIDTVYADSVYVDEYDHRWTAAADSAMAVSAWETSADTLTSAEIAEWEAWADSTYVLADTAEMDWEAYDFESEGYSEETEYDFSDVFSDSLYMANTAKQLRNDSIQNALVMGWLQRDFESFLNPTHTVAKNKHLNSYDKNNTLVHFWMPSMLSFYKSVLPAELLAAGNVAFMGMGDYIEHMYGGYEDFTVALKQDANKLAIQYGMGFDKKQQAMMKDLFKMKVNNKFKNYIPAEHLGYLSINLDTEAQLKAIPKFIDHTYAPLVGQYGDLFATFSLAMEIALDEKAIANVFGGDNLLFINDLQKKTVEYIDYEYDENYDYTEVTKTKEEYIPSFLYMFTSKDQRIFKKLLAFAVSKEEAQMLDGLYTFDLKESNQSPLTSFYVTFKGDIAFLGNDKEQMLSIEQNRFKAAHNSTTFKEIKKNVVTLTAHTAKMPETFDKLGIPVIKSWQKSFDELKHFGDVSFSMAPLKKGRVESELSVGFPKSETNALQYLLKQLLENKEIATGNIF